MKTCTHCKIAKPSDQFFRSPHRNDSRGFRCLSCLRINHQIPNPGKATAQAYAGAVDWERVKNRTTVEQTKGGYWPMPAPAPATNKKRKVIA